MHGSSFRSARLMARRSRRGGLICGALAIGLGHGLAFARAPEPFPGQVAEELGLAPGQGLVIDETGDVQSRATLSGKRREQFMKKWNALPADQRMQITVFKTVRPQRIEITPNDIPLFNQEQAAGRPIKVSTGTGEHVCDTNGKCYVADTPSGDFDVDFQDPALWSNRWQVYMYCSTIFNGGIAIHATYPSEYGKLGQPASHGCVRMRKDLACALYDRVEKQIKQYGKGSVLIVVK